MNKVVLAYSGGLDTSVAVAWLREQYGVEVVTLTVDLGGGSLREGVERRAIRPARRGPTSSTPARRFVSHSSGRAPGRSRSTRAPTRWPPPSPARSSPSSSWRSPRRRAPTRSPTAAPARATTRSASTSPSMPSIRVSRSSRRCGSGWACRATRRSTTRSERGIEIPITKSSPYSIDVNLWGRSCETGVLEDPWVDARRPTPTSGPWRRPTRPTRSRSSSASRAASRCRIDGERLDPVALVERLHDARRRPRRRPDRPRRGSPGRHQEPRDLRGAGGRDPAPGASRARGPDPVQGQLRFNRLVADELAQLIYDGLWFSALSRDLRAYALSSQRVVSGDVRMRLDHGQAVVVGPPLARSRCTTGTSPRTTRATPSTTPSAVGFIEIFGLPLRVEAARHGAVGQHHGAAWTWTDPLLEGLPTTMVGGRGATSPADPVACGSARRSSPASADGRSRGSGGYAVGPIAPLTPDGTVPPSPADRTAPSAGPAARSERRAWTARVPPRVRPARHPGPGLGRADADPRRPDDRPRSGSRSARSTSWTGTGSGSRWLPPMAWTAGQVGQVSLAARRRASRAGGRGAGPISSSRRARRTALQLGSRLRRPGHHAMLSMPLIWNERVVGVLNVQTAAARDFSADEVEFLATIAALLGGDRGEGPAAGRSRGAAGQAVAAGRGAGGAAGGRHPRAADARSPWCAPTSTFSRTRRRQRLGGPAADLIETWRAGRRRTRSRAWTGWSTRSSRPVRGEGLTGLRRDPFDVVSAVGATVGTLALLLRTRAVRWDPPDRALVARRRRGPLPAGPRAAARQRGQVRAPGAGRVDRRLAPRWRGPGLHHRRRAGRPDRGLGGRVRALRARRSRAVARIRDRPVRGTPPDGGDGRPGLDREERLRRIALRGGAADRRGAARSRLASLCPRIQQLVGGGHGQVSSHHGDRLRSSAVSRRSSPERHPREVASRRPIEPDVRGLESRPASSRRQWRPRAATPS